MQEQFMRTYKNPADRDHKKLQGILSSVRKNGTKIYGEQICIKSKRLLDVFNKSRIKEVKIK